MSIKLIISHNERGEPYNRLYHQEEVLVGRDEAVDLRLDDPAISLVHCSLRWHGDTLWLLDRDSTNGTRVAGQPAPHGERVRIASGARIALGPFQLQVTTYPRSPRTTPAPRRHRPAALALTILMGAVMASAAGLLAWLLFAG